MLGDLAMSRAAVSKAGLLLAIKRKKQTAQLGGIQVVARGWPSLGEGRGGFRNLHFCTGATTRPLPQGRGLLGVPAGRFWLRSLPAALGLCLPCPASWPGPRTPR